MAASVLILNFILPNHKVDVSFPEAFSILKEFIRPTLVALSSHTWVPFKKNELTSGEAS
jgi:hypothetical protein